MAASLPRKLWTVGEYEQLVEKGVLDEDDRVELIRGEIVEMAPVGTRHISCVINLQALFHRLSPDIVTVSVQNPVRLPNDSEPQPDVALLKGPRSRYKEHRPSSEDVLLLVEVSDSTLGSDRYVKAPLYAEAGIPEVWVVNLDKGVIEVFSQPAGGRYKRTSTVGRGETLAIALPGGLAESISVDEVLG